MKINECARTNWKKQVEEKEGGEEDLDGKKDEPEGRGRKVGVELRSEKIGE
jgi:hypothetical protein